MPLPPPACARSASHRRTITVQSYARDDGLWDVEGHLTDIWPEPVTKAGDVLLPGGAPMHEMWLRLTVDRSATIVAAVAATDAGPYDAACSAIAPDYGQLVGVPVARGYRDASVEVLKLLQRIRDESHRVANSYNAQLRLRKISESILDEFPGIGDKRKQALLKAFGSVARLRKATVEEIAEVPGISKVLAGQVKEFLESR